MDAPGSTPWDGRERRGRPRLRQIIDRLQDQIARLQDQIAILHVHMAADAAQIKCLHDRLDRLNRDRNDREETVGV